MSRKIAIAGHQGNVNIEVLGYANLNAKDISDANWLNCIVAANVEHFAAQFNASFTTSDFVTFHSELRSILANFTGSASFVTDEENLSLKVELLKTGGAHIKGMAQIYGQPRAALSFSFESDQSFLAMTLKDLAEMIKMYPVKDRVESG